MYKFQLMAMVRCFSFYFGGARSKLFATLRNVLKLLSWGQDWARKVCRFFGFIRLFDEVRAELVPYTSTSLRFIL